LFIGYALERKDSLAEPAAPTYIWGIPQFFAFFLFALTLSLVARKSRKCLVAAAIASNGGYLVSQAVVVFVLERDTPFLDLQPQDLLSWGLPLVTVVVYRSISELMGHP
jgi:hypothetical protein